MVAVCESWDRGASEVDEVLMKMRMMRMMKRKKRTALMSSWTCWRGVMRGRGGVGGSGYVLTIESSMLES